MLPMKSRMLTALLIAALAMPAASPALAWGKKEQRNLAALALLGTLGALYYANNRDQFSPQPKPQPQPQPLPYPQPAPQASIYQTPVAYAFQRYTYAERQRIQSRLAGWGYYRGGIDGSFGPGTYTAITSFARANNQTARLDSTTDAYALLDGLLF